MASLFEVNVNVPSRRAYVASTSTERRRSPRVGGVQVGNLVRLTAAVTPTLPTLGLAPTLPTLGLGRGGLARKEISTEKRPRHRFASSLNKRKVAASSNRRNRGTVSRQRVRLNG